jgi:hypothetical protein
VKTATATRRFHLFPDAVTAHNGAREPIEVPEGVSWLVIDADGSRPRCLARAPRPRAGRHAICLEPLAGEREAHLLMCAPPQRPVRINGEGQRRVAVLRDRDVLEPAGSPWTLDIALHLKSQLGVPPMELVGKPCPLCGVEFTDQTRIWICPACGTALHDEPGKSDKTLQCLRLCTECPGCRGPLVRRGYLHLPRP